MFQSKLRFPFYFSSSSFYLVCYQKFAASLFLFLFSCVCAFVCLWQLTPASQMMKLLLPAVGREHKTEENCLTFDVCWWTSRQTAVSWQTVVGYSIHLFQVLSLLFFSSRELINPRCVAGRGVTRYTYDGSLQCIQLNWRQGSKILFSSSISDWIINLNAMLYHISLI